MTEGDPAPLLTVDGLNVAFGGTVAVADVSLTLRKGEAVALAGSNGMGKSTTLMAIAGGLPLDARSGGRVLYRGEPLRKGRPEISMVPESDKVFMTMTVDENLRCITDLRGKGDVGRDDVLGWFPRLAERHTTLAGNLSGGEQQMLAIGMALVGSPRLLLLDEPTLGLAVPMIRQLCETLRRIRQALSLSILVAEADSQWLSSFADSAFVIQRGRTIAHLEGGLDAQSDWINNMLLGGAATPEAWPPKRENVA